MAAAGRVSVFIQGISKPKVINNAEIKDVKAIKAKIVIPIFISNLLDGCRSAAVCYVLRTLELLLGICYKALIL